MVWPSPTNHGECPANRCGLNRPGDRRAGCPHPAGPCGGANACGLIWPPCQRGRKRRSGDCVERSRRSREPQFKTEEFLRHVASLKRHLAVKQSLRHGLRPCHLPLTREAKRCGQPGNNKPCDTTNQCRGRCLHRPEGPRTAARSRGRAMALPYKPWRTPGQPVRPRPPGRP